ncbi:MAG: hypothetical protein IH790_08430 [Acidobacteria bacterium]|nr:hypothetical protein [Acidobacteriota bacterium]
MRRRSRLLRVAKWGGVVVCVSIALVWVGSGWYRLTWKYTEGYVTIQNGAVCPRHFGVGWAEYAGNPDAPCHCPFCAHEFTAKEGNPRPPLTQG